MQCNAFKRKQLKRCGNLVEIKEIDQKLQYCEKHREKAWKLYQEYKQEEQLDENNNFEDKIHFTKIKRQLSILWKVIMKRSKYNCKYTPEGRADQGHQHYLDELVEIYNNKILELWRKPQRQRRQVSHFEITWTKRRRTKAVYQINTVVNTWRNNPKLQSILSEEIWDNWKND